MAQFINRPASVYSSLTPTVDALQIERMRAEQARQAERDRQRKLLTMGLGMAAGGVAGIALAPAMGLGGSALAGSTATTGAGAGISSVAATTLTPMGAFLGGVQGAGIGGQIAGMIGDENYAGAAGALGQAAAGIGQRIEDQSIYGYSPTDEERSVYARQAASLGANMRQMRATAAAGGGSIPDQLSALQLESANVGQLDRLARDMNLPYTGRELASIPQGQRSAFIQNAQQQAAKAAETQQYQTAYQQTRGRLDAEIGGLDQMGFQSQPDANAIARIQNDMAAVDRDVAMGIVPFEKAIPSYQRLNQELSVAKQGKKQPKQPMAIDHRGQERAIGSSWEDDGIIYRAAADSKGRPQVEKVAESQAKKPVRIDMGGGNTFESMNDAGVLADGTKWRRTAEGVAFDKPEQTPGQKATNEAINNLFKPDSTGSVPGIDNPELVGQAMTIGDRLDKRPKLDETIAQVEQNPQAINEATIGQLVREAQYIYGPQWGITPAGQKIAQFDAYVEAQKAAAIAAQPMPATSTRSLVSGPPMTQEQLQAPPPPPPGSAASAETGGMSLKQRLGKAIADKAIGVEKAATKAASSLASTGIEARQAVQSKLDKLFEKTLVKNIEAGIDEPIFAISPDGQLVPIIKGSLTAELIAEWKAQGYSIPGVEGG